MYNLGSGVNITPRNLQVWNNQAKMYVGNTIEYDLKSHKFKTTIGKFTKVHIKWL